MEDLEEFKNAIINLQKEMDNYFNGMENNQSTNKYTVPGFINQEKKCVKNFLEISSKFDKILKKKKNEFCDQVIKKKDFKGGNSDVELDLKIQTLKNKIKIQNQEIETIEAEERSRIRSKQFFKKN